MAKQMKPHPDGLSKQNPHAKSAVVGKPSGVSSGKGKGYNSEPHAGGPGRGQNLTWPAAGELYNKPLPNTGQAIVSDGVGGGKGKGYQKDAHSDNHHGPNGQAVGSYQDHHMSWKSPLQTENIVGLPKEGANGKALHHGHMGEAHKFKIDNSGHGYGHSVANRKGPLRMSGHSRGHRIGCK